MKISPWHTVLKLKIYVEIEFIDDGEEESNIEELENEFLRGHRRK
jgi:hypothetical protein